MSINLFESEFIIPAKQYSFFSIFILFAVFLSLLYEDGLIEGLVVFFSSIFSLNILFNLRFALKILNEFAETEEERMERETRKGLVRSAIYVQVKL